MTYRTLASLLRRLRLTVLAVLAVGTAADLSAQGTGTLSGRVTDGRTHLALGGTRVGVAGTPLQTFAGPGGGFTLFNVPAGPQTVELAYVGYPDLRRSVTVQAGATVQLEATFGSDVVTLDKVIIAGSAVGSARAINRQRAADTLTNLVAADEIGRFPDQNAAESMQRIPGVALYRDQGEGRFIVVRGIRPDLNTVQLNGVSVATPDRGNRTLPLDVVPSDALGAVEIAKVATPDKEMDGLGGRVDLKTRSAFDLGQRDLQISSQGQYNDLRDRLGGKFNGTYSDVFNGGTLGVIFSPTWQSRRMGSDNVEVGGPWTLRAVPGAPGQTAYFNNDINYRAYDLTRTRYGANGALEFRPGRDSLAYVRGLYSRFEDREIRQITTIPFSDGTLVALAPGSATVTDVRREAKQLRVRAKIQDLYNATVGGEFTGGTWRFDGRAAYSEGTEDRPESSTIFRKSARGTAWSYSFARGLYDPVVTQLSGPPITDPVSFNEFNRLRDSQATGSERETNLGANARNDFTLAGVRPAYVKVGAQYRAKTKTQEVEQANFAALPGYTFAALAEPQSAADYGFLTGPRLSAAKFTRTFIDNKGAFLATRDVPTSLQSDWRTEEDVLALYALGGTTLDRIKLAAGARYERTAFDTAGNTLTAAGATLTATPASRRRTYDHLLPGVYLTADLSSRTIVRAAWTNTLARPSYAQASLSRSVNDDNRTVTASNPGLKPLTSMNWDASIERYFASLGLVSAAVFHKEIGNFTYQRTVPGADTATGYALTTFVNGDKGSVTGLELAYQQRLDRLPAPFNGFGVQANCTFSSSSGTFGARPGENLPFIGQSKRIGNLALTFERGGLFARAALNVRSARLREDEPLGASAAEDRYVDDFAQLDFTASYRVNRQWELFGEILNVTNEPFRVHFAATQSRFVQFEEYGVSANFGVRWKL